MIGAKSIATVLLLVIVLAIAWVQGVLNPAYLARLDPWVAALLGIFACLAGVLTYRIWGLHQPSASGLRFGSRDNIFDTQVTIVDHLGGRITVGGNSEEPPLDFPPAVQRAIVVLVLILVGLIAFNNRTLALLEQVPDRMGLGVSRFCEDFDAQEEPRGPEAQGCELVRRAYLLGYAESLGECEPKLKARKKETCKLRQRDEPYLHYAWRLLIERSSPILDLLSGSGFQEFKDRLQIQWDYLDTLIDVPTQAITSMPRASHHLWTTLPRPRPGVLASYQDKVAPGHCQAQTTRVSQRWTMAMDAPSASDLLEGVFGQILFDPRYQPIVGLCGEYFIHWDAPADACRRLADDPRGFLTQSDALEPVLQVLGRLQREQEISRLRKNHPSLAPLRKEFGGHESIVSFQCFSVDADMAGAPAIRATHALTINGLGFRAAEIRVTEIPQGRHRPMELAQLLASLLARGFYYGRLMSQETPTPIEEKISLDTLFAGPDFLLAKLEYLNNADPFLAQDAMPMREDLYQVASHHQHVRSFVEVFRRQYKQQRGRL